MFKRSSSGNWSPPLLAKQPRTIALPEDIVKSVTVSHMVTNEQKLDGEESDIEEGDEEDEDLPDVEIGL